MAVAPLAAGFYDHAGWAAVVCVADGRVVDRRRIELIEPGLSCFAYHHAAQGLPIDEGVALVERVRASALRCAAVALDAFPKGVRAIAIRRRPVLPPSAAERIQSYYAQTRADGVMYRGRHRRSRERPRLVRIRVRTQNSARASGQNARPP